MLTLRQLAAVQKVGQRSLTAKVLIYKRQPYAHDDSNPYGDDTVTHATTPITVTGWLVPTKIADFVVDARQVVTAGSFILRVPVGTDVEPGDRVVVGGKTYAVSDSTTEQTWPEWITVNLRRAQ